MAKTRRTLAIVYLICLSMFAATIYKVVKPWPMKALQKPIVKVLQEPKELQKPTQKVFKIFFWTHTYLGRNWWGAGNTPYKGCQFNNCFGTSNLTEYNTSDAVMFQRRFIKQFPKHRVPNQKWILHIVEAPTYEPDLSNLNGIFNVTMTYRFDQADIFSPYFNYAYSKPRIPPNKTLAAHNYAAEKKKLVTWFASNCQTLSKREKYVEHLKKRIQVDVYGKCGNMKSNCPRFNMCSHRLLKDYKFYLAFENSICDDYITEKLDLPFLTNVVPIVMGGLKYERFLPPKSFINIGDFSSAEKLADYLRYLDANDDKYNEYFAWKSQVILDLHIQEYSDPCAVCKYLNKHHEEVKVHERLDLEWNKHIQCHSPGAYYPNIEKNNWL